MQPKDVIKNIDKIENSHTYQSGVKGAVDEAGKALQTVGQAVNAALLPIQGMIWGADKIKDWLNKSIAEKLENVASDKIIPPNPHIAGPAVEALRFTAQETELREMFSTLLANSINTDKNDAVHPAFVDIIKSMNNIDALILRALVNHSPSALIDIGFAYGKDKNSNISYVARNVTLLGEEAKLEDPWLSLSSIENLERMGLCVIIKSHSLSDELFYNLILENKDVKERIEQHTIDGIKQLNLTKGAVEITQFGRMFVSSCIT